MVSPEGIPMEKNKYFINTKPRRGLIIVVLVLPQKYLILVED